MAKAYESQSRQQCGQAEQKHAQQSKNNNLAMYLPPPKNGNHAAQQPWSIPLNYELLYLDERKEASKKAEKEAADYHTSWHWAATEYVKKELPVYEWIDYYCGFSDEQKAQYTGEKRYTMSRQFLTLAADEAARQGDLLHFKWFVELGADLAYGQLTTAALNGRNEIIEYLLDAKFGVGLNPNFRFPNHGVNKVKGDPKYFLATNSAACNGFIDSIVLLVNYGAYLSACDDRGDNPLNILMYEKNINGLMVLIDKYSHVKHLQNKQYLDFHNVGHTHKNVLAQAYWAMSRVHIDLINKLCEENPHLTSKVVRSQFRDVINDELNAWVKLFKKIESTSGLSPLDTGHQKNLGKESIVPVSVYTSIPIPAARAIYISDFYHAAQQYIDEHCANKKNSTEVPASKEFIDEIGNIQLQKMQNQIKLTVY